MVIVGALLFAGSISAADYHGCGRGYAVGYYAPRPRVVVIERPAPRYYVPYEYRHRRRCHEEYRGAYYR